MGIKTPGYRLKSQWDLPSFRTRLEGTFGQAKSQGGAAHDTGLNLVPMIDVFSTVLLFLVTTFSATGEILLVDPSVKLPVANHGYMLTRSPIVTVNENEVILEGAKVGENAQIKSILRESDWEFPEMKAQLRSYKEFFEQAQPDLPFPGEIIIQADKELSFLYLKRVMFTLVQEGYTNISLVVQGVGTGAKPMAPGTEDAGAR